MLSGCTSKNINTEEPEITGNWNWIESFGGIAGILETPESTGNTIQLEITNNTINRFVNGQLESSLTYIIEIGDSSIINGEQEMIVYENNFRQSYILIENTLFLYDECDDCFQHEFERE
jgi:hypothetical protein